MLTLPALHDAAWARLTNAANGQASPIVTFASWGPDGPQMRTVVLRRADRDQTTLTFYSDLFALKIAEITADPRAGLHLWDRETALQLRATGLASLQSGPDTAGIWANLPPEARRNYGVTPPPGREIPDRDAYTRRSDPAAFATITLSLTHLDVVHLKEPHARALFTRADDWKGTWLSP